MLPTPLRSALRTVRPTALATMLRAILRLAVTLLIAAVFVFLVMDALPGDVATQSLGPTSPEALASLRAELGLDRPVWERLGQWLFGLATGDLGTLALSGKPLASLAAPAVRNTLLLAAVTAPIVLLVGVGGGVYAGSRPGSRRDRGWSMAAQTVIAVPDFAVATLLVVILAAKFRLVPQVSLVAPGRSPLDSPNILVIPALSLGLAAGAWLLRMVRSVVADAAELPHVQAATGAGVHPARVVIAHILPVVAAPIAQLIVAVVPYLLSGAVVVESVVGYPGIGGLLTGLVGQRETTAVASLTVALAAVTLVLFALADTQRKRLVVTK
ncbi:ABC transporter permease [Corynebacterium canis]|uniref:ABC transporter permease n=1 Tax=Corynebacterium canis TaxID=679663 RepID=UPI001645DF99|nr:ABC transporter permease [Corynebacterium canis]